MNTPTRQAPHICDQVLFQISASCLPFTRNNSATMIQDTRIAVPPTPGLKSNTALMVAPCVIEDWAPTTRCSQTMPGRLDQGPVQATTTTTSTAIGSQASPRPAVTEGRCVACLAPA